MFILLYSAIAKNLDKASVIRMTISFLRMTKFADQNNGTWKFNFLPEEQLDSKMRSQQKMAMDTLKVSFSSFS